jgi:hypothetical protein
VGPNFFLAHLLLILSFSASPTLSTSSKIKLKIDCKVIMNHIAVRHFIVNISIIQEIAGKLFSELKEKKGQ